MKTPEIPQALQSLIVSTPDTVSGWARFEGTRLPLQALVDNLVSGMTPEEFMENYGGISLGDIAVVQAWMETLPLSDYPNTLPEHYRFMVQEDRSVDG